jgi:hypothetical protein
MLAVDRPVGSPAPIGADYAAGITTPRTDLHRSRLPGKGAPSSEIGLPPLVRCTSGQGPCCPQVCWLGGWTRDRLSYLVMLVRVTKANQK